MAKSLGGYLIETGIDATDAKAHINGDYRKVRIYFRPNADIAKHEDGAETKTNTPSARLVEMSRETGILTVGEDARAVKVLRNYKWVNAMKDASEEAKAW